jgi:hypothetical protein
MSPESRQMHSKPFIEHRVDRGQGKVYARDYDGAGPAAGGRTGAPQRHG